MRGFGVRLTGPAGLLGRGVVGLVDKQGAFVLMAQGTETQYYKYSSEADLIARLQDDLATAEEMVDALTEKASKLEQRVSRLEQRAKKQASESQTRKNAVRNAATKVTKMIPNGPKRDKAIGIFADAGVTVYKSTR